MRERSQRGYRLFSPFYDSVFGATLQQGRQIAVAALECRPGDHVLEVCVGSGLSLPLYPERTRVIGVDLSADMLAKATARVHEHRLAHVAGVLRMDAETLAFADDSFDAAAVMFAISGLPDPLRAMRELARVCRPGARIVIASHFRATGPLMRTCEGLLAPIYRLLQYRADLDLDEFVAAVPFELVSRRSANLLGYSTILVFRNRSK